ncbi:MAG: DNA polymerase III subunit gamma/tau [Desulfobacterales bacterium]|nr:DNA polymerase III subunit gamma/tau [Desulfobacterales bacterium]
MSMENTLYRKYRPRRFADMVGQDKVTRPLRNAFRENNLVHAFLFTGTKGTGKTTVAKILAKLLNCEHPTPEQEPCNKCPNCLAADAGTHPDIKEEDAASNRGIDNIRQLVNEVSYRPTQGKYRVTIIDEAHMLTTEAFNALLKTMEEPPEGVAFILVTTEAGKIPATVASRCQVHRFTPIAAADVVSVLISVAKKEKIGLTERGAAALAAEAAGSLRDALGKLQQLRDYAGGEEIDAEVVYDFLGVTSSLTLARTMDLVLEKDLVGLLSYANEVLDGGTDPVQFVGDLQKYLHKAFRLAVSAENRKLFYSTDDEFRSLTKHADAFGQQRLIELVEIASKTLWRLGTNAVPRLTLEAALTYMAYPEYDSGDVGANAKLRDLDRRVSGLTRVIELLE